MKKTAISSIMLITLTGLILSQTEIGNIIPPVVNPRVDFFQEEITLTITDTTAKIEGMYHFRNNTDRDFEMPVVFPFYIDSLSLFPYYIEAYMLQGDKKIFLPHKEMVKFGGIRFKIPLEAGRECSWYLDYEQKIKSKRAVYIITSTAAWKKPLEKATYAFVTPESFKVINIWPEPDSSYSENGFNHFISVRRNFMPSKDMEIIWK
jgi:hypothetical protein